MYINARYLTLNLLQSATCQKIILLTWFEFYISFFVSK